MKFSLYDHIAEHAFVFVVKGLAANKKGVEYDAQRPYVDL
jgi:hypothetical protein